jgi:poly-gamma-glutamate system protein
VALGASGSFPGLLVAGLVAVETLGAHPRAILSLGASSYGATQPEFHLLDLHGALLDAGVVRTPPAAVSLGGEGDVGETFDPEFRAGLVAELSAGPTPFIHEPELQENVARRMAIYAEGEEASTGAGTIAAFINIGGAEANLGTDAVVLSVPPGLSLDLAAETEPPPPPRRGVLFEMASRGVPAIHLLNLRGLALRFGLPWDPTPLPPPATTELRDTTRGKGLTFWLLTAAYALALGLIAFLGKGPDPELPETGVTDS